jgi:hypothetical protein
MCNSPLLFAAAEGAVAAVPAEPGVAAGAGVAVAAEAAAHAGDAAAGAKLHDLDAARGRVGRERLR